MVSLGRNYNTSAGGGVFFSDASVGNEESDTTHLQPVLGNDMNKKFVPLNTICVVALELSVAIAVAVTAVTLAVFWPLNLQNCGSYYIILYLHAAFWCISLIVDNDVKQKHHNLRVNGYLEFYQQTHSHSRLPFYIVSFWNTVLLVFTSIFHHVIQDFEKQCGSTGFERPVLYLCMTLCAEAVLLSVVILGYMRKVLEFNRSGPAPDVQREEWMVSFIQDSYSAGEVGYRERGDHMNDLLEKQADLIRCLRDRNNKLSEKILTMSSDSSGP